MKKSSVSILKWVNISSLLAMFGSFLATDGFADTGSNKLSIEYRSGGKSLIYDQFVCTEALASKGSENEKIERLKALGLKLQFSSDCKTVKVHAENTQETLKAENKKQSLILIYPSEIELEGKSALLTEVTAKTVKVPSYWSSPRLSIISKHKEKKEAKFINEGLLQVSHLKLGKMPQSLAHIQNETGASIEAQEISAVGSEFQNLGQIAAQKSIQFFGKSFQNSGGSIRAKEKLTLWFNTFQNQKGIVSGSETTFLSVNDSLENREEGIFGSPSSITEIDFGLTGFATRLGELRGKEVHLSLSHSSPVEIRSGVIQAESSVSIFSPVKIFLPFVSIQTPLLNLAVPDFQLEPLMDCATTVIHCNPNHQFCLTSDFTTQGAIRFLESKYCRAQPGFESKEKDPQDAGQAGVPHQKEMLSQALVSLETKKHDTELMVQQKHQELIAKVRKWKFISKRSKGPTLCTRLGLILSFARL